MESVIERINNYKKEFYKTNNFYLKISLFNLVYLLEHYTGEFDNEFHSIESNDKRLKEIRADKNQKFADYIQKFMNNNKDLIENIISPYKTEYELKPSSHEQYIDPNTCLKIVGDFLLSFNPYMYNLFCTLYNEQRILFTNRLNCGTEMNAKSRDTIHIFLTSLCNVSDMSTLVHEMGHAYKDYCFPEYHNPYGVSDVLRSEMASKTLELIFLIYLINNIIYYDDSIKHYNWFLNQIYLDASNYSSDKIINSFVAKQFAYLLGGIVANNYVFEPNISYDDFIRKIQFSNIDTIIKDLNKNNKVKKYHF